MTHQNVYTHKHNLLEELPPELEPHWVSQPVASRPIRWMYKEGTEQSWRAYRQRFSA